MSNPDKQSGLKEKYTILKQDGRKAHPDAKYFVLRYDGFGDHCHVEASRKALRTYAKEIQPYLPKLAAEIFAILNESEDKGSLKVTTDADIIFQNIQQAKRRIQDR